MRIFYCCFASCVLLIISSALTSPALAQHHRHTFSYERSLRLEYWDVDWSPVRFYGQGWYWLERNDRVCTVMVWVGDRYYETNAYYDDIYGLYYLDIRGQRHALR